MPKPFAALLVFIVALVVMVPVAAASQISSSGSPVASPNDLQTKVYQDTDGNVHVLWLVPGLNGSLTGSGIWYSRYSPNGTDTIPPTRITNSTTAQSADMAVDNEDNAIIVWSDDVASKAPVSSALYLLHFNSSTTQQNKILTTQGSLILWPSLAGDKNGTIYMTWTEYDPSTQYAIVEYGTVRSTTFSLEKQIASYNGVAPFPPKARVVLDNSSGPLQVAWGESQADGQSSSTVNYARVGFNGTVLTQLQVAKFVARLRDLSITPTTGQDGAFVIWQTQASNAPVYVSQISAGGQLAYLRELNYTTGQSKYLAFSTDMENNLYVMWYQPSVLAGPTTPTQAPPTNVTYLRMNFDGDIIQSGSGVFRSPIIGVTVLNDGNLYGVSLDGLVKVVAPPQAENNLVWVATVAVMSCLSVSVAGSLWIEEGRYKWVAFCSRIASPPPKQSSAIGQEILRLLTRKPGLNIRDIKRLIDRHDVGTLSLIGMERTGLIASFRDGLSRRFYVKTIEGESVDSLRNRIMLWVLDHPGIWEAQLAKDLGFSQQIVHYHLKKLRESRLITTTEESEGRKLYRFANSVH